MVQRVGTRLKRRVHLKPLGAKCDRLRRALPQRAELPHRAFQRVHPQPAGGGTLLRQHSSGVRPIQPLHPLDKARRQRIKQHDFPSFPKKARCGASAAGFLCVFS